MITFHWKGATFSDFEDQVDTLAQAALALNEDSGAQRDGKQIQRRAEAIGRTVVSARDAEVRAFEQGTRPATPANAPALLVIGMDGGRLQTREKQGGNGSRWREDKVGAMMSYLPGDGTPDHPPERLVTTDVATMERTEAFFGKALGLEAERRGMRQAGTALVMGDGGNWIDPLSKRECLHDQRIADHYHAAEHLYEAGRSALGKDTLEARALPEQLKDHLWAGRIDEVILRLQDHADHLGPPQAGDGSRHPHRVLANNIGYFKTHRRHMDYPAHRRKGWPIGSGATESVVELLNKRVNGTEQFWSIPGVESILSLRALWLSQDDRWTHYWNTRPAYPKAA